MTPLSSAKTDPTSWWEKQVTAARGVAKSVAGPDSSRSRRRFMDAVPDDFPGESRITAP